MNPERPKIIDDQETRFTLLRLLAIELIDCRPAFLRLDLSAMEKHIAQQERLCARISELNERLGRDATAALIRELGTNTEDNLLEPRYSQRHSELLSQTKTIAQEVRRLNQIHQGFLVGSRRTFLAISNLLASYRPVYEVPALLRNASLMQGSGL